MDFPLIRLYFALTVYNTLLVLSLPVRPNDVGFNLRSRYYIYQMINTLWDLYGNWNKFCWWKSKVTVTLTNLRSVFCILQSVTCLSALPPSITLKKTCKCIPKTCIQRTKTKKSFKMNFSGNKVGDQIGLNKALDPRLTRSKY